MNEIKIGDKVEFIGEKIDISIFLKEIRYFRKISFFFLNNIIQLYYQIHSIPYLLHLNSFHYVL